MRRRGFTLVEVLVTLMTLSIFTGIVTETITKSYRNNRQVETQAVVQSQLNLAIDRLSRVMRSVTMIVSADNVSLKVRGYPNAADTAPSEIYFYITNGKFEYSVIPPSGTAPNYTYNPADAKYYTLVTRVTNTTSNPAFKYYNDVGTQLSQPISISSIRVVEPVLSATDTNNVLKQPIIVSTKITLRNFKTNL